MKSHLFVIIILTIFFFISAVSVAQTEDTLSASKGEPVTIRLSTYVESNRVPLNGKVQFNVELSWVGELSRFQIDPVEQPFLTNLILEGSGSANKLEPLPDGNYRAVKTIMYQLKPVEMGMAYIDGMLIKYKDQLTGETDELQSQRVMVEIIEPVNQGGKSGVRALIYIILLIIFSSSMVYFLLRFIRKRKQSEVQPAVNISPGEEYLMRIGQEVNPKGNNLSDMTNRLSRIFREYLAREFKIPAREASSTEIIEHLEANNIEPDDLKKLKELFKQLDLINFAGGKVDPAEFSNIYGSIETFLLKQKKIWEAENEQVKEA